MCCSFFPFFFLRHDFEDTPYIGIPRWSPPIACRFLFLSAAFSFSGFLTPHPADTVAARRIDGGGHAGSMLMGLQQVERIGRHLRVAAISGLRPKKTRFRRRSIDNRELYRCTVGCINIYEPFLLLSFFFLSSLSLSLPSFSRSRSRALRRSTQGRTG